jgi:membrane protein YdbS with pleckstrin-like domain
MSPEKKSAVKEKGPSAPKGMRIPILWELINTIARIVVLLLGIAVGFLSYQAGCAPIWIAIRSGAAMLALGLLFWLIYWFVARGSLFTMHRLLEKRQQELGSSSRRGGFMEFKV